MATKRRMNNGPVIDGSAKGQKRRRVSAYAPETEETPESTSKVGQEVLDRIKRATDKHGNPIATEFLQLPDQASNPDYYAAIRLPMALDIVEEKLKRHEYPQLTSVESDLRRMVSNAKFYNLKGSQLFSNAERIRKVVAAVMPKLNPAYKDPNYVPFSTPLPDGEDEEPSFEEPIAEETPTHPVADDSELRDGRSESTKRVTASDAENEAGQDNPQTFEGETFQGALERIVVEAIRMKDSDGQEVFYPFLSLPDRTVYKDYYEVIMHPISLRAIFKLVRGTDRRKSSTKGYRFKNWQAFEDEVSYLWVNAREFNEDDSEIVAISHKLEDYFRERIAEAKKFVPDPPQVNNDAAPPRIKLRMKNTDTPESSTQKLTLRLPSGANDAQPSTETLQTGVTVDSEALKRQQAIVKAGTNGAGAVKPATPSRNLRDRTASAARMSAVPHYDQTRRTTSHSYSPMALNSRSSAEHPVETTPSGHLGIARNRENSEVKPEIRHPVRSPMKASPIKEPSPMGNLEKDPVPKHQSPAISPWSSGAGAPSEMNNQGHDTSLISNITVTSHQALNLPKEFYLDIPSPSILGGRSVTINLPSTYRLISISPTVASNSQRRQTQHYLVVGGQRIAPTDTAMRSIDLTKYVYDIHLRTGVTKIEVWMTVSIGEGDQQTTRSEHVSILANLLRA